MHRRELITGLGAAGMFGVAGAQAATMPGQTVLSSFETGGLYDIYFENSGLADTVGVRMEATSGGNHIRGYNNCQRPVEEIAGQDSAQQPNTIT